MAVLFFGGFFDHEKDKIIFSKGHAAPLLYSLYHAAGMITSEELLTLRKFGSRLEGHPTPKFPFVEVATGSLGQGLSMGVGMAMGSRQNVFVLFGDSEMAEGQIWEALEIAAYYKLNNLIGILDVNRLGQRGETMLGWDLETYQKRISSFGWNTIVIDDGHDLEKIYNSFQSVIPASTAKRGERNSQSNNSPTMIIAKTVKGKGISFLENQEGWHGKTLTKEELDRALKEIGDVNHNVATGGEKLRDPDSAQISGYAKRVEHWWEKVFRQNLSQQKLEIPRYARNDKMSAREAYGDALVELGKINPNIVVLDAETSNSTFADKFNNAYPERFFEMFIAEQNMISTAVGLSKQGFIPFVSSFSAFLTRTFDQIRMAQYSNANIKIVGSHCGVSIGPDGPSQMGLEDIAMMRSILNSTVFYPSDAVSTLKLTEIMANTDGIFYLRTTREKTPVLYSETDEFKIGGSKILRQSEKDTAVIFSAGITIHEALKTYEELKKQNVFVSVVDLYCVKPLDIETVTKFALKTKRVVVVEDHYPAGGLGEAVLSTLNQQASKPAFAEATAGKPVNSLRPSKPPESRGEVGLTRNPLTITHLCVRKIPCSGTSKELLKYEEINSQAIIRSIL
jgi:transketolase